MRTKCVECGAMLKSVRNGRKYCSVGCTRFNNMTEQRIRRARKSNKSIRCVRCNREIDFDSVQSVYCSDSCRANVRRNYIASLISHEKTQVQDSTVKRFRVPLDTDDDRERLQSKLLRWELSIDKTQSQRRCYNLIIRRGKKTKPAEHVAAHFGEVRKYFARKKYRIIKVFGNNHG